MKERQRTTHDFRVEVQHFEIASGYDGMLRGAPEITVVMGVYAIAEQHARTLTRAVFRAPAIDMRFPQVVPADPEERAALATTVDADGALLLVACGVEDDGGGGVARVFGALERCDGLTLATADTGDDVVTLRELDHLPTRTRWMDAKRALVMIDGVPLQTMSTGDDWVGAAAVCIARTAGARRVHRFHLATDDLLNDWTVVAQTKVGFRA